MQMLFSRKAQIFVEGIDSLRRARNGIRFRYKFCRRRGILDNNPRFAKCLPKLPFCRTEYKHVGSIRFLAEGGFDLLGEGGVDARLIRSAGVSYFTRKTTTKRVEALPELNRRAFVWE